MSFNLGDYKKKKNKILDWLESLHFKFYEIKATKKSGCIQEPFYELSRSQVEKIDKLQDIFIIPGHINPDLAK